MLRLAASLVLIGLCLVTAGIILTRTFQSARSNVDQASSSPLFAHNGSIEVTKQLLDALKVKDYNLAAQLMWYRSTGGGSNIHAAVHSLRYLGGPLAGWRSYTIDEIPGPVTGPFVGAIVIDKNGRRLRFLDEIAIERGTSCCVGFFAKPLKAKPQMFQWHALRENSQYATKPAHS